MAVNTARIPEYNHCNKTRNSSSSSEEWEDELEEQQMFWSPMELRNFRVSLLREAFQSGFVQGKHPHWNFVRHKYMPCKATHRNTEVNRRVSPPKRMKPGRSPLTRGVKGNKRRVKFTPDDTRKIIAQELRLSIKRLVELMAKNCPESEIQRAQNETNRLQNELDSLLEAMIAEEQALNATLADFQRLHMDGTSPTKSSSRFLQRRSPQKSPQRPTRRDKQHESPEPSPRARRSSRSPADNRRRSPRKVQSPRRTTRRSVSNSPRRPKRSPAPSSSPRQSASPSRRSSKTVVEIFDAVSKRQHQQTPTKTGSSSKSKNTKAAAPSYLVSPRSLEKRRAAAKSDRGSHRNSSSNQTQSEPHRVFRGSLFGDDTTPRKRTDENTLHKTVPSRTTTTSSKASAKSPRRALTGQRRRPVML